MPQKAPTRLKHTLKAYLQEQSRQGFSGSLLVSHEGKSLINDAFGSLNGQAIRKPDRFCIASLGKQFTSAAMLKCAETRSLSLNSSIADFIQNVPPEKHPITLLHLLSHTSGWPQTYAGENHADRESAIQSILAQPLVSEPGQEFHYANDNYQLVAAIIEIVSGRTYQEFVVSELFDPIGLENTSQINAESVLQLAPALEPFPARFSNPSWGQEGFYSTTQDLFHWYTALRKGEVLQKQWIAKLFAPVFPIREGVAALGWFIGEMENGTQRIFSRGNEDFGANSLLYAYPERDTVIIVLTHAGDKDENTSYLTSHPRLDRKTTHINEVTQVRRTRPLMFYQKLHGSASHLA